MIRWKNMWNGTKIEYLLIMFEVLLHKKLLRQTLHSSESRMARTKEYQSLLFE